jgi:hypothetical protein
VLRLNDPLIRTGAPDDAEAPEAYDIARIGELSSSWFPVRL